MKKFTKITCLVFALVFCAMGMISCGTSEGFVENTALHQAFSSSTDRSRYMEGICYSLKGCEVCPIHQINSKLWEGKDE